MDVRPPTLVVLPWKKKEEIGARIAALHAMSEALSSLIAEYSKDCAGASRPGWVGSTLLDTLEASVASAQVPA